MNVAIPHWQGRISPVFDVAGSVLVIEVQNGAEVARFELAMDARSTQARAERLARSGADVLICGAISRPVETALEALGLQVISQTCGDVEQVLAAFLGGQLSRGAFLMPGCCGRRRRGAGRRRGGRCTTGQRRDDHDQGLLRGPETEEGD